MKNYSLIMSEAAEETGADAGGGGGSLLGGSDPGIVSESVTSSATEATVSGGDSKVQAGVSWMEGLSDEIKSDPSLLKFQDVGALAKSYKNLEKMIGRDKIVLPDKHATADDWRSLFHKLGQPQKFEEYQVDVPKDASFDDGFVTEFKKQAFENNILPKQAEALLQWYEGANAQAQERFAEEQTRIAQEQMESLKKEWGATFQTEMARMKHVMNMAGEALGEETLFTWLNDTQIDGMALGSHPVMLRLMSFLSKQVAGEDQFVGGDGVPHQSAASIQEEINSILGNKDHPYYDKSHPNHDKAVKDMLRMHEILHPQDKGQGIF